ncbi:MAG: membrane protein [Acidimicrobiales bacterium]
MTATASAPPETSGARTSRLALGGALLFMGTLHFLVPGPFTRLIPGWLGDRRRWVYASGLWELVSAGLLLNRRTAKGGGYAAAATIVAVYPGNIKMAFDAGAPTSLGGALAWGRLPLQVPLFAWAWQQTRR